MNNIGVLKVAVFLFLMNYPIPIRTFTRAVERIALGSFTSPICFPRIFRGLAARQACCIHGLQVFLAFGGLDHEEHV